MRAKRDRKLVLWYNDISFCVGEIQWIKSAATVIALGSPIEASIASDVGQV
jgi:hypothetical protein